MYAARLPKEYQLHGALLYRQGTSRGGETKFRVDGEGAFWGCTESGVSDKGFQAPGCDAVLSLDGQLCKSGQPEALL